MDPCGKETGYSMNRPTADIVTISHENAGHNNVSGVAGSPGAAGAG